MILRFLLLLLLTTTIAAAREFDIDLPVGNAPTGTRQVDSQIRVAPDGTRYAIWQDARNGSPDIM